MRCIIPGCEHLVIGDDMIVRRQVNPGGPGQRTWKPGLPLPPQRIDGFGTARYSDVRSFASGAIAGQTSVDGENVPGGKLWLILHAESNPNAASVVAWVALFVNNVEVAASHPQGQVGIGSDTAVGVLGRSIVVPPGGLLRARCTVASNLELTYHFLELDIGEYAFSP